jgi:hypothetical protein
MIELARDLSPNRTTLADHALMTNAALSAI